MKLNENERTLVRALVDFEANLNKTKTYLKETYNIDVTFDEENTVMRLISEKNNALDFIHAKKYVNEVFGNEVVTIVY